MGVQCPDIIATFSDMARARFEVIQQSPGLQSPGFEDLQIERTTIPPSLGARCAFCAMHAALAELRGDFFEKQAKYFFEIEKIDVKLLLRACGGVPG